MSRKHTLLVVPALMVAVFVGDGWVRGEQAFLRRDFAAAASAFAEALTEEGDQAPAELHYDHALASFAAGSIDVARASAERAAALGDASVRPLALHLLGTIEWKGADAVAAMAAQVEAEPFLFDQAIERTAKARAFWVDAAKGNAPLPESVRNAERALLRLQSLREQKAERDRQRKAAAAQQRPMAVPDGVDRGEEKNGAAKDGERSAEDSPLAPLKAELSQEQLDRMFERLEQREREKQQLRRSMRAQQQGAAERDW